MGRRSAAAEEHGERKEGVLEAEQFQRTARLCRTQLRSHRHRAEDLALHHELIAFALNGRHRHQLLVVWPVEFHGKLTPRSSNALSAAARPAPNTPPPGCWNGPTRYSRSTPGTVI